MASLSRDVFTLHTELRAFRSFADKRADDLMRGFDRGNGETVTPLALDTFDRLRQLAEVLSRMANIDEDEQLSEVVTTRGARLAAIAVHVHVATRHQAGRTDAQPVQASRVRRVISAAEAAYTSALFDTRASAKSGRIARLADAIDASLDLAEGELGYAALALAGQNDETKSGAIASPRLGEITRRVAMLAGAAFLLMFRMTNAQKAAGLRTAATNRAQLARSNALLMAATPAAAGPSDGDTVKLRTKAVDIEYVDDDEGFSRITVDAGDITELRLPRRNVMRIGVVPGSWLALEGTVVAEPGQLTLAIGREAIGTHAADVWEDYLVSEMRPLYDMRPGSVDMAWELPDLRAVGGRNDLHGRL